MSNDRKSPLNPHLRDARLARGWSQEELAGRIGTTSVNISRWENGLTFPFPHFRLQLCKVFDKTPAELGLLPPSSPDARVSNMPITRSPFFTGREQLLALLHQRLSIARMAALTQTQAQALFGLGGIGKTQTAAEYVFRYGNDYTGVFWIYAATRETLVAGFVTLAELLDLPAKDKQDQSQTVAAVKRWLSAHEGWLLVLDNADDLRLAQEFLPTSHKGYILFTTRAQASGAIAASVEVDKLPLQEGILLLLRWTKLLDVDASLDQARVEDRADAERVVREMDGLPLALVQVGAYVEETGCSLANYLRLYATHRKDLLSRRSSLLLDYPETVATTWEISFEQVGQQNAAAADILRLCAFLAADAIPEELLMRGIAEPDALPATGASDAFKLNQALEVLRKYSLVRRDGRANMVSIHRLVQAVLRENMDQQTQHVWAERTVRTVSAAFSETHYGTGETDQFYMPHVQDCATLIEQYRLQFPEAARLLYQAGLFLYFHGFHTQSHSFHQQALAIREQAVDPDFLAIAESLNALAILFRNQGDSEQAERFHLQALEIRQKELGLEHSVTAESLNNLGVLYRNLGNYEQARHFLKLALDIREQVLGSEHRDTLNSYHNLAKLYSEQRNYEQAEQLLMQALTICERVLEPGDPVTAQNLNLLAKLYYGQADYERAETFGKRSLAILEETLGPEHPATAGVLYDLADLSFAQGRYTQAESFCQRALGIYEKIFGSDHPDTVAYRQHLSRIVSKREAKEDGDSHLPSPPA